MKLKFFIPMFVHYLVCAFIILAIMIVIVNLDTTNAEKYQRSLLLLIYTELVVIILMVFIYGTFMLVISKKYSYKVASIKDYEVVFNGFEEGLVIVDQNDEVIFVSDNLEDILGYTKEEIRNLTPIHDNDSRELVDALSKLNSGEIKDTFRGRYYIFNKVKMKNVYIEIKIDNVEIIDLKCVAITISDVTNKYEENKELVGRLSKAETTVKNTSAFMSRVSHEIRTPLNGVIGMNEIALENLNKGKIDETKEALSKVDFSAKYLLSILNDVLDLAKIESGKMAIDEEVFSLSVLIDEIEVMFSSTAASRNIEFKTITNFDDINIITDKTKLTQIIVNFVSNALKYTEEGGHVSLIVNRIQHYTSKVSLEITIKDDGIGMEPECVEKMFEPFTQERRSTTATGSGLGLAITRSMISLLNGTIDVKSEVNKGTEIKMTYVFDLAEAGEKEIVQDDFLHQDYSKFKVLVVEDNEINSLIIVNHLKFFNFKVETAFNGEEAFNKYMGSPEGHYDFILMDIQMPVLNGYESTRKIRESGRKDSDLIIIALTADTFKDDISKAIMYKMNQHVSKPIDRNKLISVIYQQLKLKGKI